MSEIGEPGGDAGVQSVTCTEVTGLECDYVAELDPSVEVADRGKAVDQLLAQLTTHVSRDHDGYVIPTDSLPSLRDKLTSG